MLSFQINVSTMGLEKALMNKANQIPGRVSKLGEDLTRIAHKWVQREAPRKTGKLKASVQKVSTNTGGMIFLSKSIAPYSDYVIDGTRPHVIVAKNKRALFWKGGKHPVKKVKHPGTKSNPFVDRGFNKSMAEMQKQIDKFEQWLAEV